MLDSTSRAGSRLGNTESATATLYFAIYRPFIASSMCSMRVKIDGPSAVTSTFSSRRAVCSRYGCPANVSIAKYMFSLIGAGYFIEYARDIHMPSYSVIPMLCANCCSVTVVYSSSS